MNRCFTLMLVIIVGYLSCLGTVATFAQTTPLPRREYYLTFENLYRGEFDAVQREMQTYSRSALVDPNRGRYLDSVCYWTILGESYYHRGQYRLALEQYTAALELYLGLQGWVERVQLPATILVSQESTRNAAVPWAASSRAPTYAALENELLILFGKSDAENAAALRNGGTLEQRFQRRVGVGEAMRCVALALHRRKTITGPIGEIDPLTKTLSSRLIGRGGATLTAAWTGVVKGIAYAAAGDDQRATQTLNASLKIAAFDHPLTPLALLTLGDIAAKNKQFPAAQKLFLEASICAAAFEQPDVIEESLRKAALIHSATRTDGFYSPVVGALEWARTRGGETLRASLTITDAWIAAEAGDTKRAKRRLGEARRFFNRNELDESILATRVAYIDTMARYIDDDVTGGDQSFDAFLASARKNSLWLFQVGLADEGIRAGAVTEREAEALYDALLREPDDDDWTFRPLETVAYMSTPHFEPMERWFEITLSRKAEEKAMEISERIRRQRFHSSLPFGGRLLSLRWILEAPNSTITKKAQQQKVDLARRYPIIKELSDKSETLRKSLSQMSMVTQSETPERAEQEKLLAEYAEVIKQQEGFLRKIALIREPTELAFPRPLSVPEVQKVLPSDRAVISFLKIGQKYYVLKLSGGRYVVETVLQAKVFEKLVRQLVKQLGIGDKSVILDPAVLAEDQWRETARELSAMIFAKTQPQALDSLEEIVFVPDGIAWYLPMEILQVGTPENSANLNSKVRVRYAPMVNLAVPDGRSAQRFPRTGLIAQKNFIRDSETQIQEGVADIQRLLPDTEVIDKTFVGTSSMLASTIDQLIVWHVSSERTKGVYGFAPFQIDVNKPGSGLASWMSLPWRGIDQMVLSGVSSAIEGAQRNRALGNELFLTTCSLMASGSRTVLISRWRVGGQSALQLTREFALELGKMSASKAWQRSLDLLYESDLDITAEPRLRDKVLDQPLSADHPFLWAGYMLIDSGAEPREDDAEDADAEAEQTDGQ